MSKVMIIGCGGGASLALPKLLKPFTNAARTVKYFLKL